MNNLYADGFTVAVGLVDTKIDFLTLNLEKDETGGIIEEKMIPETRITMSLALAKELAIQMGEIVRQYEDKFGPIPDLNELRKKAAENGK